MENKDCKAKALRGVDACVLCMLVSVCVSAYVYVRACEKCVYVRVVACAILKGILFWIMLLINNAN